MTSKSPHILVGRIKETTTKKEATTLLGGAEREERFPNSGKHSHLWRDQLGQRGSISDLEENIATLKPTWVVHASTLNTQLESVSAGVKGAGGMDHPEATLQRPLEGSKLTPSPVRWGHKPSRQACSVGRESGEGEQDLPPA